MAKDVLKQFNEQFEQTMFNPARQYFSAVTDHLEAVAGIQVEAAKALHEITFKNARAALEVRDPESLREYVTRQPEVAKEVGEIVKSDAEKLTAANQNFAETAQKVTRESVASAQKAAEAGAENVQSAAKSATPAAATASAGNSGGSTTTKKTASSASQ